MFNNANVDNRLRHYVRGRVLVFTTSLTVEFLDDKLAYSYPLYNRVPSQHYAEGNDGKYPVGHGLTFVVELNGQLTFDEGSQVKIHELSEYRKGLYDPTLFTIVKPADQFLAPLVPYTFEATKSDSQGRILEFQFYIENEDRSQVAVRFASKTPLVLGDSYDFVLDRIIALGLYQGKNGYSSLGLTGL